MFLGFFCDPTASAYIIVMFSSEVVFTPSIRVLSLNMVFTWYLFGFSMYSGRFPIFLSLILFSWNLTFDFFLCAVSFFQCSFYLGLGYFFLLLCFLFLWLCLG